MTTSVDLVLLQYQALGNLEYNTRVISKFLGPPPCLSLSEACEFGTVGWLDLIWCSSCTDLKNRIPTWSLTNYLRSDPHYYRWQFSKSLYVAAKRGNIAIVEWLLAHFEGYEAPFIVVVKAAAANGHLHLLQLLWEHRSRNLDTEGSNTAFTSQLAQNREDINSRSVACTVDFWQLCPENWGRAAIEKAVDNGQLKECLDNGMTLGLCDREIAIKHALNIDQREFAESLLPKGTSILHYAHGCPRPEVMIESGRVQWDEKYATWALSMAATSGSVEIMEQLFQHHSPLREDIDVWKKAWDSSITEACSHGALNVVKWLLSHSLSHELCEIIRSGHYWRGGLMATEQGHLEVIHYLYEHGLYSNVTHWPTENVIRKIPLALVKWLVDCIWIDHPDYSRFATAEAAKQGRVDLLEFFQSLDIPQRYEALGNRRRRTDSSFTWDNYLIFWAASYGQVAVLEWLQENRPWETDRNRDAMDAVASEGYLDSVKWLHANRPEGCSNESMYGAARSGHFEVVKWLYENCLESRTFSALERAIQNGHLRIAYWLRTKYPDYLVTDNSVASHERDIWGS